MRTRNLLIFLLLFLSIGALIGGGAFLLFPNGFMDMPTEQMLENSPFTNFFIPGLILFTVLGLFPILIVWGLNSKKEVKTFEAINIFRDMHWSWSFSIYVGFALLIWIFTQVYILQDWSWMHFAYFYFGILILVVTLLKPVREIYRK